MAAYKDLARLERDFRHLKADDLDLRPIWHRLEDRVRAHVLICMLACYLTWHLRQAWAPLTYTDEHQPGPRQPRRSGPPLTIGRRQGRLQDRTRQAAHPRLPRPDRPPGHPDPRHHHRRRAGTEFFVAYGSEGPFRELLAISLLMPVIIAVVPDRIAAGHDDREVPSGAPGKMPERTTTIA